jgi:hypothetical protein
LYKLNRPRGLSLFFRSSKIHVSLTDVISTLSPSRCRLSSGRHRHTAAPCYTSFTLSQDELIASASSSSNILFCHLLSRVEIEVLNPHHHHRLSSSDRLTHTLLSRAKIEVLNLYQYHRLSSSDRLTHNFHCYKKIILTINYFPHHSTRLHFTHLYPKHYLTPDR